MKITQFHDGIIIQGVEGLGWASVATDGSVKIWDQFGKHRITLTIPDREESSLFLLACMIYDRLHTTKGTNDEIQRIMMVF